MKKFLYLLLLGFLASGCALTQDALFLKPDYSLADLKKTKNSILLGKVSFQSIPGDIDQVMVVFVDQVTEKVYPIHVNKGEVRFQEDPKLRRTNFYYFIQLPEGSYNIPEVIAKHSKFEQLETHLLNANLTIPKNSIIYIGTIHVKGIGAALSMLGPVTESEIIDEHQEVIKIFKEQYPQFTGNPIESRVIDRYELFKKGGMGGEF